MLVGKQMKLHQRCVDILEMIRKCNGYIQEFKRKLAIWDASGPFDNIRLCWERHELENHLARYRGIKSRLSLWYADIAVRLNEEVYFRLSIENKEP